MLRRLFTSSLLALAALAPFTVRADGGRSIGAAEVVVVQPARVADLVLLGHGFDAGLREGMVCRVTRAGAPVAEVILVELRAHCASALILDLVPGQSIRSGDTAQVKVLKT